MIVFQPALLLEGSIINCIIVTSTCILGTIAIVIGIVGFIKNKISIFSRICIALIGVLLLDSNYYTDIIAIFMIMIFFAVYFINKKINMAKST